MRVIKRGTPVMGDRIRYDITVARVPQVGTGEVTDQYSTPTEITGVVVHDDRWGRDVAVDFELDTWSYEHGEYLVYMTDEERKVLIDRLLNTHGFEDIALGLQNPFERDDMKNPYDTE